MQNHEPQSTSTKTVHGVVVAAAFVMLAAALTSTEAHARRCGHTWHHRAELVDAAPWYEHRTTNVAPVIPRISPPIRFYNGWTMSRPTPIYQ